MFKNIISVLNEFEETLTRLNKECPYPLPEEDENILNYFELSLSTALMQNRCIDSEKLAKIILASKGLSNEIKIKIE